MLWYSILHDIAAGNISIILHLLLNTLLVKCIADSLCSIILLCLHSAVCQLSAGVKIKIGESDTKECHLVSINVPWRRWFFYQNQFFHSYKTDGRIIKNIIANNVQCSNKSDTLKFITYYRSNTITKLITRNNQGPPTPPLKKTN